MHSRRGFNAILTANFVVWFSRVLCHLTAFELMDKIRSLNAKFYFTVSYASILFKYFIKVTNESWWMCGDEIQKLSMEFHYGFKAFGNFVLQVWSWWNPTLLFYHRFCLCVISFNANKTHITLVRMDSDRIRMESDSDITFYHILNRIRIRIQIFSNADAKRVARIGIYHRIFTQFNSKWISLSTSIQTNNISCQNILPVTISMIKYI
jgi:hypothetical protein